MVRGYPPVQTVLIPVVDSGFCILVPPQAVHEGIRMLDRSRRVQLGWSVLCLGLLLLLTLAVVQEWAWLADLDEQGRSARTWAIQDAGLREPLRAVEVGFSALFMAGYSVVLALLLSARGHRRAGVYVVLVMLSSYAAFRLIKLAVGRDRPPWQWGDALHGTRSFPSGHATMIAAFAVVMVVLALMLLRRATVRRLTGVAAALLVVLVCLDRVLLGRHYPTDVVGGVLLGVGLGLLGLALYSPLPRSHAEKVDPLPEAFPSARKLAVVLNPIKVEDVGQFQSIVDAMAAEAGWSAPTWHLTTVEDSGTGQAERASIEGADLVIVCGGDGTVREVCAELAGTGIPVGIVPAGTGNLLARNLGIPLYIRAAIDIALTGQDRAIDMVAVSGDSIDKTHFMVMAGMGFDAAIMEGVNEQIKKKVGWLAYVLSALKSLMFPVSKVEISVDGGDPTTHRARTIVVGNVGYLQAGMPLLPDAAIDDGQLDVVILYPRRFLSWVPLAYRVLAKRPHTDDTINRMTGQSVVIRASSDVPRQLDGDSIGSGKELRMECIHGRLLVRVPR
jgi:YegS/Rv2252/BmrU family lipid kinase